MFDFEIYWDDSGTHKQSPIAVATCYVATKEQWERFELDWDEARQRGGFDVFHMADFMATPGNKGKPFWDWDKNKKNQVYFRIANIINNRVRMGFAVAVPKNAYDLYAPDRFRREYAKGHYAFAVKCCMGMVGKWHETYAKGQGIKYVFDKMGKGCGEIQDIWKMAAQEPIEAGKCGLCPDGYSFQSKRDFNPLQAADILAWNMYAAILDGPKHGRPAYLRPYFKVLTEGRPMGIGFFDEQEMKSFFDQQKEYESRTGKPAWLVPKWKIHYMPTSS